jgi:hypothetical protein
LQQESESGIMPFVEVNDVNDINNAEGDIMKDGSVATKKVFLGGTCNESTWRDELIKKLTIDFFNPVVEDWTPECMAEEIKQRETCDIVLYVITPKMTGVYSIAEVVDDSNKRPEKTVFCFGSELDDGFDEHQIKSMKQVEKMVKENGATVCDNLQEVADFLNKQ